MTFVKYWRFSSSYLAVKFVMNQSVLYYLIFICLILSNTHGDIKNQYKLYIYISYQLNGVSALLQQ